eukprot:scaffold30575_cov22-Tisochrysis_lutea.AAC.1
MQQQTFQEQFTKYLVHAYDHSHPLPGDGLLVCAWSGIEHSYVVTERMYTCLEPVGLFINGDILRGQPGLLALCKNTFVWMCVAVALIVLPE